MKCMYWYMLYFQNLSVIELRFTGTGVSKCCIVYKERRGSGQSLQTTE